MQVTLPVYFDIQTGQTYTNSTFLATTTAMPVMYEAGNYVLEYHIAQNAVALDLSTQSNFKWGICEKDELGLNTPSQTVTGDGTNINNSADTPDLANGVVTVRVIPNVDADLGSSKYITYYTELRSNSTSDITTVALHQTNILNIVYT